MENRFLIKCTKCSWNRVSTGLSEDLKDLKEIKKCATCGGPRKFRCPKCGEPAKQFRIKGNS